MSTSSFYKIIFNITTLLVPGIFLLYWIYLYSFRNIPNSLHYGLIVLVVSLLWVLINKRVIRWLVLLLLKRMLTAKATDMFGKREISIDDKEIRIRKPNIETVLEWESIKNVHETDKHFFLYFNSMAALIIPKRFDDQTSVELSKLIKDYSAQ